MVPDLPNSKSVNSCRKESMSKYRKKNELKQFEKKTKKIVAKKNYQKYFLNSLHVLPLSRFKGKNGLQVTKMISMPGSAVSQFCHQQMILACQSQLSRQSHIHQMVHPPLLSICLLIPVCIVTNFNEEVRDVWAWKGPEFSQNKNPDFSETFTSGLYSSGKIKTKYRTNYFTCRLTNVKSLKKMGPLITLKEICILLFLSSIFTTSCYLS